MSSSDSHSDRLLASAASAQATRLTGVLGIVEAGGQRSPLSGGAYYPKAT